MNINNHFFSHIYIEKEALENEITKKIVHKLDKSEVIVINHYKDIFCRAHQDTIQQKQSPALIIAVNREKFVYKGARVCQDFGNDNFYYCSTIMNCFYDCEYCYLQGMYSSANIVIFVNVEDMFDELRCILKEKSIYLCISYDTDMIALDNLTEMLDKWAYFARSHPNLTIEIRTKSAQMSVIKKYIGVPNFIFAWTMSPSDVIDKYEHRTAKIDARIEAAAYASSHGGRVHLCFDPIIIEKNAEKMYCELIDKVFMKINPQQIEGVSVGMFRISKAYMKNMRKHRVSAVTEYPYECIDGVYQYPEKTYSKIMRTVMGKLEEYILNEKIFIWNGQ